MKQKNQEVPIDIIGQSLIRGAKMPSAPDIENVTIGTLLVSYSSDADQAMLTLGVDAFYDPINAMIFAAMLDVQVKGSKVDMYTVGEQLKTTGKLAAVGGMAHLVGLTQLVGSGSNVENHTRILLEMQASRAMASLGFAAISSALDSEQDVADTMRHTADGLERVMLIGLAQGNRRYISSIVDESIARARQREQRCLSGKVTGITTGLQELDRMTNGWQPSELVILAARPAMGKTAMMLHFMTSAAAAGVPVCVYSLEMSAASLGERVLLAQCDVPPENVKSGRMSLRDWEQITVAQGKIAAMPISIDDKSGVSMRYIATHSKIMARKGKCGIIFIDYLQLLDMRTVEKGRNREQEVAQASKAAKELAKELNVPVVMLAQLSRSVESRGGDKIPMLSDLRESGAIEQDADIVMFIHRAEYYDRSGEPIDVGLSRGGTAKVPIEGLGKLIIAKNREGSTGDVKFNYNSSVSHIVDFDETPYLGSVSHTSPRSSCAKSGDRPVSSGSIHYVDPSSEPSTATAPVDSFDDLPF